MATSHAKQRILEHAHSILIEYCLLNGPSHNKLMNAITRDIYPKTATDDATQTSEFHSNIRRCASSKHHRLSQSIHIAHFCQLKWMSTLRQRPLQMLPSAHHLILFFNHLNIANIQINDTQRIRDELIIQCLLSLDSIGERHLQ